MYRIASLVLCLSASTTADAGGFGLATGPRATGISFAKSGVSTAPTREEDERAAAAASTADTMEVEFLGSGIDRGDTHAYDIAVDGDAYTVEVRNTMTQSAISLYDEDGKIVVGYVASATGAVIFDREGLVENGAPGEVSFADLGDYGSAATLLTNPAFLSSFLAANGETFGGGDDDPPGMWWWVGPAAYMVARCLEVEIAGDLDGVSSWSVGWDC